MLIEKKNSYIYRTRNSSHPQDGFNVEIQQRKCESYVSYIQTVQGGESNLPGIYRNLDCLLLHHNRTSIDKKVRTNIYSKQLSIYSIVLHINKHNAE